MELDYFIDAHCHMFTAADIPLWKTIKRTQRDLRHPLYSLLMTLAPWVDLDKFKPFITFFESEPGQVPERIITELTQAMAAKSIVAKKSIVLTPLIMDFDLNGEVVKLDGQISRLKTAVAPLNNVKILPFIGVDPRKFVKSNNGHGDTILQKGTIRNKVKKFLDDYEVKNAQERKDPDNLKSGDIIGVKLYPPLGFKVCPVNAVEREAYFVVYKQFLNRDIPVTVHCQEDSFELTYDHNEAKDYTNAYNWINVFNSSAPNFSSLRINFGHFGGEKGVKAIVDWPEDDITSGNDPVTGAPQLQTWPSWTRKLITLLKNYDNTYADISAFDFGNSHDSARLLWVISNDIDGAFGNGHALLDKLMWGSDYPMILDGHSNYKDYFKKFMKVIKKDISNLGLYTLPDNLPPPDEILKKLVCDNPQKFLFG